MAAKNNDNDSMPSTTLFALDIALNIALDIALVIGFREAGFGVIGLSPPAGLSPFPDSVCRKPASRPRAQ